MAVNIKDYNVEMWSEVHKRVIGGLVFIDDVTAECLHWEGGLFTLLDAGAVNVRRLSMLELAENDDHKKAVFIGKYTNDNLTAMKEVIQRSKFTHCMFISTTGLDIMCGTKMEWKNEFKNLTEEDEKEILRELEITISQWMVNKPCRTEVVHIPIFTISITNDLFLMPPHSQLYSEQLYDNVGDIYKDINSVHLRETQSEKELVSSINSLFEFMDVKEDIFYVGEYSSTIAHTLEKWPMRSNRRKNSKNRVTVIFVDRTLDVCGVTSHGSDSLLDKIMATLPKLPEHTTDVAVDMSPICEAKYRYGDSVLEMPLSPGCLSHPEEDGCSHTLDHLVNKQQREVMFHLYNKLTKVNVATSPPPRLLQKITPQIIEKVITPLKGRYDLLEGNLGLLQQCLAAVQALKSSKLPQLELIASLEKQVLENMATSRDSTSVLSQICHLIKNRKARGLEFERLLALLVHVYALAGTDITFSSQQEQILEAALSQAIHEECHQTLNPEEKQREFEEAEMRRIMISLKEISQARAGLKDYRSVVHKVGATYEYKGVLQQLVEDLASRKKDLKDIKAASERPKDLLQSGLHSLLRYSGHGSRAQAVSDPLHNPLTLLVVLGGTSADEARRIHEAFCTGGGGGEARLILAATRLLNPVQAMLNVVNLTYTTL